MSLPAPIVPPDEVRTQLERIVASAEFANAPRMTRFLRFVVDTTLAGAGGVLKESRIGIEVFDRDPSYDPKGEPIVRTEARRLRAKLESYYQGTGKNDPIEITVPRGGYVPRFQAREGPVSPTLKPPFPLRRSLVLAGSAAATLLIGFVVADRFFGERPATPLPRVRRVTTLPGRELFPSISPDGQKLSFGWDGEKLGSINVYTTDIDGSSAPSRWSGPGQNTGPRWSPDGKWIAWVKDLHDVYLKSTAGGPERRLAQADYNPLAWTPDSRQIVLSRRSPTSPFRLYLVAIDTLAERQLTDPPDLSSAGDLEGVVSPDGKTLAFNRYAAAGCDLWLQPLVGGAPTRVTSDGARIFGLSWTPDSKEIVYAAARRGYYEIWRVNAAQEQTPRLVLPTLDDLFNPSFGLAKDGRTPVVAYQRRRIDANLWAFTTGTSQPPEKQFGSTRIESSPSFSPAGDRVVFVSDRTGYLELWIAGGNGSHERQLTFFNGDLAGSPRWSADGQNIAFDAQRRGLRAVFILSLKDRKPRQLTPWGAVGRPSWSRDGQWVYYFCPIAGEREICKSRAASTPGSAPVAVTRGGGFEAFEAADGQTLYYTSSHNTHDLWRMRLGEAKASPEIVIPKRVSHGYWSLQRDGIVFVDLVSSGAPSDDPKTPKPLLFYSFQTHRTVPIGEFRAALNAVYPDFTVFTPPGATQRRVLFARLDSEESDIEMFDWRR